MVCEAESSCRLISVVGVARACCAEFGDLEMGQTWDQIFDQQRMQSVLDLFSDLKNVVFVPFTMSTGRFKRPPHWHAPYNQVCVGGVHHDQTELLVLGAGQQAGYVLLWQGGVAVETAQVVDPMRAYTSPSAS